jgi:hypothetical protein
MTPLHHIANMKKKSEKQVVQHQIGTISKPDATNSPFTISPADHMVTIDGPKCNSSQITGSRNSSYEPPTIA